MTEPMKYAVLIDADNIGPQYMDQILDYAAEFGTVTHRRVYGDFTKPVLFRWKEASMKYALIPVQNFCPVNKKNSTDFALVIDAMDIMHEGKVDGFVLVSSDSDYTRLAMRIKESGLDVVGIGKTMTNRAYVNSCSAFRFIKETASAAAAPNYPASEDEIRKLVVRLISEYSKTGESIPASLLVLQILENIPEYDPKAYGYAKTKDFLLHLGFMVYLVPDPKNKQHPNSALAYVRLNTPDASVTGLMEEYAEAEASERFEDGIEIGDEMVADASGDDVATEEPAETNESAETMEPAEEKEPSAKEDFASEPVELTPELMRISDEIRSIIASEQTGARGVPATKLGLMLKARVKGFEPKDYGFRKFTHMLEFLGFDIEKVDDPRNVSCPEAKVVYVGVKRRRDPNR